MDSWLLTHTCRKIGVVCLTSQLVIVLAVFMPGAAIAQQITTNEITNYTSYEVVGLETNTGTLIGVWTEGDASKLDTLYGEHMDIALSRSTDGGATWSAKKVFINPNYITDANPIITEDESGNIYLITMSLNKDPNGEGVFELYRSIDDGASWQQLSDIVYIGSNSFPDKPWLVARGNGDLFLIYTDYDFDSHYGIIKFRSSLDGGISWTPDKTMSNGSSIGASINFGMNGALLVSWGTYDGRIYFSKSIDNGQSFSPPQLLAQSVGPYAGVTELISSVNFDYVGVVYHYAHSLGSSYVISSTDGGNSWATKRLISENSSLISGDIDDYGHVHLVYNEVVNGLVNTNTVLSEDYGTTFTASQSLHDIPSQSTTVDKYIGAYQSLLCGANDKVHVFWIDWANDQYHLQHSTWSSDMMVSVPSFLEESAYLLNPYPNPIYGSVTIASDERFENGNWKITDISGKVIVAGNISEQEWVVDLSYLDAGFYLLSIQDETGLISRYRKLSKL